MTVITAGGYSSRENRRNSLFIFVDDLIVEQMYFIFQLVEEPKCYKPELFILQWR